MTTKRRLRICHIIHRLDFGGLENVLTILINRLPADRFDHAIICLTEATEFRERITRPDVPIIEIHKRTGKDIAAYGRVWRALRDLKPDIVHTRNLPAVDMLAPAKIAGVKRLVHSEHGLDVFEVGGGAARYRVLRRLTRLVVDRYVSVSHDLKSWMVDTVGLPADLVTVIHNGVDSGRFCPPTGDHARLPDGFAPPGTLVVGAVGRLERIKDQLTLARAFARLLTERPELRATLRLAIIGDGRLRPEIEAALADADALSLAWLPGFENDMPALYRAFDVYVLPSLREGISNTLLESMASGLPAIATGVGGNPELVLDGETGRLVPPEDVAAMASAIASYADDPALAAAHGAAARERALQSFSIPAMLDKYAALYGSLA